MVELVHRHQLLSCHPVCTQCSLATPLVQFFYVIFPLLAGEDASPSWNLIRAVFLIVTRPSLDLNWNLVDTWHRWWLVWIKGDVSFDGRDEGGFFAGMVVRQEIAHEFLPNDLYGTVVSIFHQAKEYAFKQSNQYHKFNVEILYRDMGAKGSKQEPERNSFTPEINTTLPKIRKIYDKGDGKYSVEYDDSPLSREDRLQQIMYEANQNTIRANQQAVETKVPMEKSQGLRENFDMSSNSELKNAMTIARTKVNEGSPIHLNVIDFLENAAKHESTAGVAGQRDAIQFLTKSAQESDRLLSIRATKFLVYMMDSSLFTPNERENAKRILVKIANNSANSERGQIAKAALFSDDNPILSPQTGGKKRNRKSRRKPHKSRRKYIRRLKRTKRK